MNGALTAQRVDVTRRFWDAFAGEPVTLERLRAGEFEWLTEEFFAPEIVFDLSAVADWPEAEIYEGYEGIRRFYEIWFGAFDQVSFEVESVEAIGDVVLSIATQRGGGLHSHTPVEWRNAYLTSVDGSKIVRSRFFSDPDEAMRTARAEAAR